MFSVISELIRGMHFSFTIIISKLEIENISIMTKFKMQFGGPGKNKSVHFEWETTIFKVKYYLSDFKCFNKVRIGVVTELILSINFLSVLK